MKRKSTPKKLYSQLPEHELEKIAAPFEKEFVPTKPLTPSMRKRELRAKKRGRPVVGDGAEKVLVTLERGLLRQADAFAKKHHKNRSQLIAMGLLQVLRSAEFRRAS